VVVLPQPPFWLMIATVRMATLPWLRCDVKSWAGPSAKA
jgi:hypothetical protein